MPRSLSHWQQLEDAGLRSRFSCCYPYEHEFEPIPSHWRSVQFSLPDHRRQEPLQLARLSEALDAAQSLFLESAPLYLHCMAGIERSPLIAVGLTARARQLSLFDALDWVRRCHPPSLPIYSHLDLMEQILR
jgi:protein-tyrosine phosphatase